MTTDVSIGSASPPRGLRRRAVACGAIAAAALVLALFSGCAAPDTGSVVYYCDGAGWYSGAGSVRAGLRKAGFDGAFIAYPWSSFLGPAQDHFINARSRTIARGLTRQIEKARRADPDRHIHVMGLSAGTAVVLNALEQLPEGVMVDNVVLFAPSVSSRRNLRPAMEHVRRNLYFTASANDGILNSLAINADGLPGEPAGLRRFVLPSAGAEHRIPYQRVVSIPWQPSYIAYGWGGGHTSATSSRFVAGIIAPRIMTDERYPLDRPLVRGERVVASGGRP